MSDFDLMKRIDEIELNASDRAAAKAQAARAERLVDWTFAAAGSLRRLAGAHALAPIKGVFASIRSFCGRFGLIP